MPIKFRCQHCEQLMGISRSKAGEVVDCPTCGLSVRVPGLDGAIAPIPLPRLDLKDAELTNALDELAGIGANVIVEKEEQAEQALPLQAPVSVATKSQVIAPVLEQEFQAVKVQPTNQIVAPPQREEVDLAQHPETPVAPVSQLQVDTANPSEINHEQELESLASLAQKRASNVLAEKKRSRLKRSVKFELPTGTWVFILLTLAALTFSIGFLVGRNMS
ncbi:zinc ribbon domain-containing protein [uncultured Gimesia sp.]|uniref:zinc ribbon domain-containing protein n=1 Tax=uncultured Gimesia sp. TaxID=1678688 RepID=UPI00261C4443|nr:zinc ribbon domain-containing protein [uncultured Gimesia sp.]